MAAVRGKLMESLMRAETQADQPDLDAAFLTGILSLLEALFEMPQETVLENLYVSEEVRLALLERGGRLGRLLALAELLERDDPEALRHQLLAMPHLSVSSLLQMQIDAFAWANAVEIDFSR
jgi:EAL and modified HD-GYP domain-containing signal transduction protein